MWKQKTVGQGEMAYCVRIFEIRSIFKKTQGRFGCDKFDWARKAEIAIIDQLCRFWKNNGNINITIGFSESIWLVNNGYFTSSSCWDIYCIQYGCILHTINMKSQMNCIFWFCTSSFRWMLTEISPMLLCFCCCCYIHQVHTYTSTTHSAQERYIRNYYYPC